MNDQFFKTVNTWDGRKTQIDTEVKQDLELDKRKSKDDLYNEDYDRGKVSDQYERWWNL